MDVDIARHHSHATDQICRMIKWFRARHEAERELERLLALGWCGALRDCVDIWQVDVVRPRAESV